MSTYGDRPTRPSKTGQRYGNDYPYGDTETEAVNTQADTALLDRESDYTTQAAPAEPWRLGWNSGADLGLLIMRLAIGGIFAAHGAQKIFGWWGGPGLDSFANELSEQGFRQADVVAAGTAFTELVGGVLLMLGLFTPLAAAGLVAVAINAVLAKWGNGLFLADNGFEAVLALGAVAAGLTFTGPGRVALDNGRAWFRHPVATGWIFLLLGAGAGAASWLFFHG